MDLFGRKAKQAQLYAEAQLNVVLAWNADLENYLDRADARNIVLQGVIDRLKEENTNLTRKLDEVARSPRRMSAAPLYKSEEEEELEYALRNGDIDMREFKDLMAQLGFDNTDVELPERPERPIVY